MQWSVVLLMAAVAAAAPVNPACAQRDSAGASPRQRELFRAGVTATVVTATADDDGGTLPRGCTAVSIEWRALSGASSYRVETKPAAGSAWAIPRSDPHCGPGSFSRPTAFRDLIASGAPPRLYRVVALDGARHTLATTNPVPVHVEPRVRP